MCWMDNCNKKATKLITMKGQGMEIKVPLCEKCFLENIKQEMIDND